MMSAVFAESITRNRSRGGVVRATDARLLQEVEAKLDAQMLNDLVPYYGELDRGFAQTHVPCVGSTMAAVGFSTLTKQSFAITDGVRVLGKVVCTLKRSGALKIGPIFLFPEHRERGHATAFLQSFVPLAHASDIRSVYATVPRTNQAAQRLFSGAGFLKTGSLHNHYREDGAEDVFVCDRLSSSFVASLSIADNGSTTDAIRNYVNDEFFPIDNEWDRWLRSPPVETLGDFSRKPHDVVEIASGETALVIYKRGGTAKVVPVVGGPGAPTRFLIEACEIHARLRGRKKVSVFLPQRMDGPQSYVRELIATRYSLRGPTAVWSRQLER